jgi:hypothetical protein
MAHIFQSIREWFSPVQTLPAGMYHYSSPPQDPRNYRLHLRLEPDGRGILIVNASTILHLNQTAAEYAYYIVHNLAQDQVAHKMSARYHVSSDQARSDYQNLIDRIQILINTPDLDPETFLDFGRQEAHHGAISAPYRLDCALTYQLSEGVSPEAAPVDRVKRELSTDEWKTILEKARSIGIPHIVFTGGEPTVRQDLADLIAFAEANDQVTGLISDGLRFNDASYLNQLLQKGLDHMMIVLDPRQAGTWDALQNILAADIFLAVHLTITPETYEQIPVLLNRLDALGVKAISLSTDSPDAKDMLHEARNLVAARGLELIWNLPVPYYSMHPVALETSQGEQIPGAGRDWLYLEPDGDVLPTQGLNRVLGNMLQDPWEKIWKK